MDLLQIENCTPNFLQSPSAVEKPSFMVEYFVKYYHIILVLAWQITKGWKMYNKFGCKKWILYIINSRCNYAQLFQYIVTVWKSCFLRIVILSKKIYIFCNAYQFPFDHRLAANSAQETTKQPHMSFLVYRKVMSYFSPIHFIFVLMHSFTAIYHSFRDFFLM